MGLTNHTHLLPSIHRDEIFIAEERERVIEEILAGHVKRGSVYLLGYSVVLLAGAIVLQTVFNYSRRLTTTWGGMSVPTSMYVLVYPISELVGLCACMYACNSGYQLILTLSIIYIDIFI
jgi:hypothetical protein